MSIINPTSQCTLRISGMTCGACVSSIESNLSNKTGIHSISVALLAEKAIINYDSTLWSSQSLIQAIDDTGFDAELIQDLPILTSNPQPTTSLPHTLQLKVLGMTCASCSSTIERQIGSLDGIHHISVALLAQSATVQFIPSVWSPEKIVSEIEDLGFDAQIISVSSSSPHELNSNKVEKLMSESKSLINIYGLQSQQAATALTETVLALNGITSATIDLTSETLSISYIRSLLPLRTVVDHITSEGYDPIVGSSDIASNSIQLQSLSRTKEVKEWRTAYRSAAVFAVPVFLLQMVFPMLSPSNPLRTLLIEPQLFLRGWYLGDWLCFFLTLPVQFGIGKRFYKSAFKSLKHRSATMDVLVVIGTTASFLFSTLALLLAPILIKLESVRATYHPTTFFDTCTMLITFVTFGRYLENLAKGQTSTALSKLISLTPTSATLYTDSSCTIERKLPTELIEVGDTLKIIPGDKIPADGTVIRGESSVDESMITGEVVPVTKCTGDNVIGGTVNGNGTFDMLVTRSGNDTALSQIVKLVEEAQTSKAPIQAFADTVAGYFVPTVLILGVLTFIGWMIISNTRLIEYIPPLKHLFIMNSNGNGSSGGKFMTCLKLCISVIVVACPCALGLSTPTAVMVGTGIGAQNGILIKGAGPLEAAHRIDSIILDKTGTITVGKLDVVGIIWNSHQHLDEKRKKMILKAITAAESKSEHPLANAVTRFGMKHLGWIDRVSSKVEIGSFESVTGKGVRCKVMMHSSEIDKKDNKPETIELLIGSLGFMNEELSDQSKGIKSITLDEASERFMMNEESEGHTCIHVTVDRSLICILSLADTIKPEAAQAIEAFRFMGMSVSIVTGDQSRTANAIAKSVGISTSEVYSNVSPNGKKSIVEKLQKSGKRVAMVGDGINDSPALACADLGIALSTGTDIAMEAAEIILMKSNLLDVVAAIDLSRRVFRQIRLNFLWASVYNLIGIPLAMGFFLPWGIHLHPMMAGAAMACSSVSVVCSSLTLRWWKRPIFSIKFEEEESILEERRYMKVWNWIKELQLKGRRNREKKGNGKGKVQDGYLPIRLDEEVDLEELQMSEIH
ncbi:E1-E2 ATPase-domain-containing protein [Melampsora americana]|nr:E1-E2 ATPase-domain-containing protein [Melampsora americana]